MRIDTSNRPIDEALEYAEEKLEEKKRMSGDGKAWQVMCPVKPEYLVSWLKELKAYREAYPHTAGKTTILKHVDISYDTQTDCPWKRGEEWNS